MSRQPIVVGVDGSPEAAAAAELGVRLAHAGGSPCQLIHAVRNPWESALMAEVVEITREFTQVLHRAAHEEIDRSLSGRVPPAVLANLIVEVGRPAEVVTTLARQDQAEMIVLGGKHHSALGRWLGGSTSHNVVRATTVPVLVTQGVVETVRRILVALDTSAAAAPTLAVARRLAQVFGAELRALSVSEPLPPLPESGPGLDPLRQKARMQTPGVRRGRIVARRRDLRVSLYSRQIGRQQRDGTHCHQRGDQEVGDPSRLVAHRDRAGAPQQVPSRRGDDDREVIQGPHPDRRWRPG